MKTYTLNDLFVRRTLVVLSQRNADKGKREFSGSKSLKELTSAYNKYYPPGIFKKIVGSRMSEVEMKTILDFLIAENLVSKELLSFTDQYLTTPELHYHLNTAGLHHVHKKK